MAMTKCKECKSEISNKAKQCPLYIHPKTSRSASRAPSCPRYRRNGSGRVEIHGRGQAGSGATGAGDLDHRERGSNGT